MNARQFLLSALLACTPMSASADGSEGTLDRAGLEVAGRYWYSTGRIGYNYYADTTTSNMVSRLTYDQLTANAGEVYLRGDMASGIFIKGYIGGGLITGGKLIDEDFPYIDPVLGFFPYSRTTSAVSGNLGYGTVDLGYSLVRQPKFRLGGFVGYGRWNEALTASGCTQLASNPFVCQPSFPTSIAGITETDNWNLLRAGATADLMLGDHVKLGLDAAYIHAWQRAVDDHLLNPLVGYDPSTGTGNGVQLEATVSYQFNDALSVGIGGRWWHLTTNAVDSYQQLETYAVDRYGVFLQGSYRFNASAP